jgi:FHS family L-fucose permease-like MFS transporter
MKNFQASKGEPTLSANAVLIVLAALFFVAGLIASQNDLLNPLLKHTFSLRHTESALIQFVYYGVFVLLAIPLGKLAEGIGYRRCLRLGLFTASAGAILFWFAAQAGTFGFFLLGIMVIATGNATLVILGNPYLSIISPPGQSAQRLNLVNGFYMVGTTLGPILGNVAYVPQVKAQGIAQIGLPYLGLAALLVLFGFAMLRLQLPSTKLLLHPKKASKAVSSFSLFKDKRLLFGIITMFVYVGAEVGAASKLIDWLMQEEIMHLDQEGAGRYLAIYWGLTMAVRFVAAALMRSIRAVYFLTTFAVLGLVLVLFAVTGSGYPAGYALILLGIANAVMFPTIFALSTQHLGEHTQKGSSFIMMAVSGGAIIPIVIGSLTDAYGLRVGLGFLLLCYGIILAFGLHVMKEK